MNILQNDDTSLIDNTKNASSLRCWLLIVGIGTCNHFNLGLCLPLRGTHIFVGLTELFVGLTGICVGLLQPFNLLQAAVEEAFVFGYH